MGVYRALDSWAPFETQMDFDNAGFLVGRGERAVSRVLVALDITEQVVEESGLWGAQLVVSDVYKRQVPDISGIPPDERICGT